MDARQGELAQGGAATRLGRGCLTVQLPNLRGVLVLLLLLTGLEPLAARVAPRAALARASKMQSRLDLERLHLVAGTAVAEAAPSVGTAGAGSKPGGSPSQAERAVRASGSEHAEAGPQAGVADESSVDPAADAVEPPDALEVAGGGPSTVTASPSVSPTGKVTRAAGAAGRSSTPRGREAGSRSQGGDPEADELQLMPGSKDINWGRQITVTVVWLSLICVAAWLILRFFYSGSGLSGLGMGRRRLIRILDRQILSPQKSLLVVEVAGRTLVLGVSEQSVQVLAELDPAAVEEVPGGTSSPGGPGHGTGSPADEGTRAATQQQLAALFGKRQPPEGGL